MKKIFFILTLIAIFLYSCNKENEFKKHESGLEYIIFKGNEKNAQKLQIGNTVSLEMTYETSDGKVLFNSKDSNRQYLRNIEAPSHKGGSFEDGLLLLSKGDSAIFRINAEDFIINTEKFNRIPREINYNDKIIIKLKVIDVIDKKEFEDIISERYHNSKEVEMEILESYLKNANITTQPTESGLYYIEKEKGSGKQAKPGDFVQVHYTVKLIDGQLVETSITSKPILFRLGDNQVIKGWEEGILYMREGGKAIMIIPSDLAYGETGNAKILPYSTLVFDVELIRIQ